MLNTPVKTRYEYPGNSYVKLYLEDGRVVDEHRYVMTQHLGRELQPWEVVHHRDEQKKNNDPGNLEVKEKGVHAREHGFAQGKRMVNLTCSGCGSGFEREYRQVGTKIKQGQVAFYCSRRCVGAAIGRGRTSKIK